MSAAASGSAQWGAAMRPLLPIILFRAVVSAAVLSSGFRAVSDDDYARVVIAQQFAQAPALDPSGTSWLPFPFWVQGAAMLLFGRELTVARVTAVVLGVAAAALVFVAARWLTRTTRAALLGTMLVCATPYFAWLGVATVPEALTAALLVLSAASCAGDGHRQRLVGAGALFAATLSRYEAWPIAFGFAVLCVWDAHRSKDARLLVPAALALVGPAAWLAHGAFNHGDPWFFVARVAAYRRALGGTQPLLGSALANFPMSVVRCEPELALLFTGAALLRPAVLRTRAWLRCGLLLLALLAFLVAGDLRDGAPTHHNERAVLAIWVCMALAAGACLDELLRTSGRARAATWLGMLAAGAALLTFTVRPWYARRDAFTSRSSEVEIGRTAAKQVPAQERLIVDTADYGYFAVLAAFADPARSRPLRSHDPRVPKSASQAALSEQLKTLQATWLVTATPATLPAAEFTIAARNERLALVKLVAGPR